MSRKRSERVKFLRSNSCVEFENKSFINRVDMDTIGRAVKRSGGRLITIEDHQIICGMGAQLTHALSRAGIPVQVRSLGIDGHFGRSAYKADHLYDTHGLNTARITAAVKELHS